jgi:hypothetical protein
LDFTFRKYRKLLEAIKKSGYSFQRMEDFVSNAKDKVVVLRHDSDIWPGNDLKMAEIENSMDVVSTYYFRVPETFHQPIINKIKSLGHEIGYHYEDLARFNGDYEIAIENFKKNLEALRKIYPVKTAARHGRPLSKWDSLDLWKKHTLGSFGLTAEPYISIDYTDILYLTDNGSKWNADKSNIRDKVKSNHSFSIPDTDSLIDHFNKARLPKKIIINAHPARWNDIFLVWFYRYLLQKTKNVAKSILNSIRNR